ncbi:MAG: hypothetical protein GY898_17330 [Proteobacteria bacterium]|nr:hypothetical protein [Pseudomonadota bacterium]
MRSIAALSLAAVALCGTSTPARADLLPAGQFIEEAVVLDLNASFFAYVMDEVMAGLPSSLVVGSIPPEEVINLLLCSQDFWVENLTINTDFYVSELVAQEDQLLLIMDFDLSVNHPSNPAWIILDGCIDDACGLWVDPAQVHVEMPIRMELAYDAEGDPYIDFELGPLQQDITDAMISNMAMGECALTTINAWWMENMGENLIQTMIAEAIGGIDTTIQEKLEEFEATAEEALGDIAIAGSTEIMEVPLVYGIEPTKIEHSSEGIRIALGGHVDTAKAPCITALDPGGSYWTNTFTPAHFDNGWHMHTLIGDDLINQALYGVWRGGVLCFEASELGETALTTSMLSLLLGEVFEQEMVRLLPYASDSPMLIRTMPWNPPVMRFDGVSDMTLVVEDLDIEFYVELEDRLSRLTAVTLDIVAVVDMGLQSDGAMAIQLAMQNDQFHPTITYDELSPEVGTALLNNFDAILDIAIGAIAGDVLGDSGGNIVFGLPTLMGLGLADMYVEPDGALLDWLSGSYRIGPSEGGGGLGAGCEEGGCLGGEEGCAGGDEGCALSGDGCAGEEGGCLSGEDGCNVQDVIVSQGCSGEANPEPTDTGCSGDLIQAACRTGGGKPVRVHTSTMLLITCLLLSRRRKR